MENFDNAAGIDWEKSIKQLDSAYNAFPNPGIIDQQQVMLHKLVAFYEIKRDTPLTYLYLDSAIDLIKNRLHNNERRAIQYALMLRSKAYCLKTVRNYNEALHYYLKASQVIAAHVKDSCSVEAHETYLADIMFAQGKYLPAAENYLAENAKVIRCGEKTFLRFYIIQKNLCNVGLCFFNMGAYDSAYIYYNQSLDFIDQSWQAYGLEPYNPFLKTARATAKGFIATALVKKESYREAEELFSQSVDSIKRTDPSFAEMLMASRAEMYVKTGKYQKAMRTLNTLDSMLEIHKNPEILQQSLKIKSDLYATQKKHNEFLFYAEQYLALKDSMTIAAKSFDSKNLELEFLKNEQKGFNQTLELLAQRKSSYITLGVIGAVLLCFLSFLIWLNLKNVRKNVAQLKKLNRVIRTKGQALENAFISVAQSNHANNNMIKIVAHDLRSPLSGIDYITHALLTGMRDTELRDELEMIQKECKHCTAIIQELLNKNPGGPRTKPDSPANADRSAGNGVPG